MNKPAAKKSCPWPGEDLLMQTYHDTEWGVPVHDDRKLFEFMILDAFQAGLSWKTILHKRENFRRAFSQFDPVKIARYDDKKVESLLQDAGIIRNRQKIAASITNARCFLAIQKEFGSFDAYIWQFTGHKTRQNRLYAGRRHGERSSDHLSPLSRALTAQGSRLFLNKFHPVFLKFPEYGFIDLRHDGHLHTA
jgi:DNA-3-methyladenine glycosylase I